MSCLKQVSNGGIVGWSESKKNNFLFAVAQTQSSQELHGQTDQFLLQIMTFDAAEKGLEPNRLGIALMQTPATSITWSTFGEDTGSHPYGLICIGHQDGSFVIYDANQIITHTKANPETLAYDIGKLCYIKEFSVPVYTAEYNSYKPNLIAIGGDEVLVIDISKDIENPDIIAPGDTNLHQGGNITSVSWNKKVPHILASASSNGVAVVWNLKTSQVSFQIPDIYQHMEGPKQLSLAWNPEIPLQFAINYDDEKKPELHIWDLRDTRGPYVSLENGHIRGIQTLSWCSTDPSLIITGGVDQRVVCWNIKTKEIIQQFYLGTDIVSIQWSKIPSLYSVALADGTVQLFSLNSAEISAHPPKWYQPVVGATFAPNNVLSQFSEFAQQQITSKVYQSKDENYQNYLRWFQELEKVIDDNNATGLCDFKLKNTHGEDTFELDQWRLLKGVAFGSNKEILEALGFKKQEIVKRAEEYTGKKHKSVIEEDNSNAKSQTKQQKQSIEFTPVNEEQADDFFTNLTVTSNTTHTQPQSAHQDLNGSQLKKNPLINHEEEIYLTEQVSKNKNWDAGVEKMIKENMIIGNYEGAIDCAIKCGRVAEALLMAYSQNAELFKSTIDQYFTQQTDNFIKYVFKNLIKNDIEDIAENYDLKSWRECAGLAITCSKNPAEFQQLMDKLAERFIQEKNDDDSAICCFILSQNFHRLVGIYFKRIQALRGNIRQRAYYMVQSIEKLIILRKVMVETQRQQRGVNNPLKSDPKFHSILIELAKIALCNSKISIAYKILEQGDPNQLRIAELKDLIYNVYSEEIAHKFQKPIQPYTYVRIPAPIYSGNQHQPLQNNQRNPKVNNPNIPVQNNNLTQPQQPFKKSTGPFGGQGGQGVSNMSGIDNRFQPTPPTIPANQQPVGQVQPLNKVAHHNTPFNPREAQKGGAPPPIFGSSGANKSDLPPPPVPNNQFPTHPIQNFEPPVNQPNKSGPPANPGNKQFNENIAKGNIAPPRPNIAKPNNAPVNPNLLSNPPVNMNNSVSNIRPPPVTNNQVNNSFTHHNPNEQVNKQVSHPQVHPNPPPPIQPNRIIPNPNKAVSGIPPSNPPLQKNDSIPPPPISNTNQRQGSNQFNPNQNNMNNPPRPGPPVANQPFNPGQINHNQPPANTMNQTRPPITMNVNQNISHPVVDNLPPTTNAPPPIGGATTQARTLSQQATTYSPSAQEIQLIEGFLNDNMGLFQQIDPKKKDEHIQQLNNLLNLLKSNSLKQEQVQLLCQICQEMGNKNQKDALNTHQKLSRIDFSTSKHWLTTLKRVISQK